MITILNNQDHIIRIMQYYKPVLQVKHCTGKAVSVNADLTRQKND